MQERQADAAVNTATALEDMTKGIRDTAEAQKESAAAQLKSAEAQLRSADAQAKSCKGSQKLVSLLKMCVETLLLREKEDHFLHVLGNASSSKLTFQS